MLVPTRRFWFAIVTALVAALAVLVFRNEIREWFNPPTGIPAFVAASGDSAYRPFAARLSGGFPYRQPKPLMRGGLGSVKKVEPRSWPLLSAMAAADETLQTHRSVETLHVAGVARLLRAELAPAIEAFEEALLRETKQADLLDRIHQSNTVALLSDLSAAYGARGGSLEGSRDRLLALEAAERAWKLAQTREIAWNRALARDSLNLYEDAQAAWNDYLHLDPDSQWAEEARREYVLPSSLQSGRQNPQPPIDTTLAPGNERALERFVAEFPMEARLYAEDTAAAEWARAATPAAAQQAVLRLQLLGRAIAAVSGDQLVVDAARVIERANDLTHDRLVAGHLAYARGRALSANSPGKAAVEFDRAAEQLRASGSPFAWLSIVRKSGCLYRAADYGATLAELDRLPDEQQLSSHGYVALNAQRHWMQGIVAMERGRPDVASVAYEKALEAFIRLRETPHENNVRTLAAQAASYCGDDDVAWHHRLAALRTGAASDTEPGRRHVILMEAAQALSAERYRYGATLLFDRLVTSDRRSPTVSNLCTALTWRALHRGTVGDESGAASDFEEATARCEAIVDAAVRTRVRENLDLVASRLDSRSRNHSIAHLTDAIDFATRTGSRLRLASLYAARARHHLASSNITAASADAEAGAAAIDAQLAATGRDRFQRPFVSAARDVIATGMLVNATRMDVPAALASADWLFRVTSMVPWDSARMPSPAAFRTVQQQLAKDAAIVTYVLDGDDLYILAVTPGGTAVRVNRGAGREIVADLAVLTTAIDLDDGAEFEGAARRLYQALIEPVAGLLRGVSVLAVLADENLRNVPFSALSEASGTRLVERLTVVTAPNMGLLAVMRGVRSRPHKDGRVLLVRGAEAIADGDEPLRHTKREQQSIARLYPGAVDDSRGGAEEFLTQASASDLVHYTGHGLINDLRPMFSALLLNGPTGKRESLYAHQIAGRRLTSAPVVVLAGCSTGRSTGARRSMGSLSQAFLAAGAPVVVGTLWDIEDNTAAFMFTTLHRFLARGNSPATALRNTQLACINSNAHRSPMKWATLALFGGDGVWNS
jgi:CHAT domain-containing protein